MFIVSEYFLSKTQFGSNPNKLSTMSIVFGLICYGALYFYFLTYYRDTLPFINQYLVYFIALDLIISIFYYYKHYNNTEPTLISSFFDKSQNGEEDEEFNVEDSEQSELEGDNVSESDEFDDSNDMNDNESDITDIHLEQETNEAYVNDNIELESIDNELQETLEKLQEQESNEQLDENPDESELHQFHNQIEQSNQTLEQKNLELEQLQQLEQLPLPAPLPKKRGRKPKNFISI